MDSSSHDPRYSIFGLSDEQIELLDKLREMAMQPYHSEGLPEDILEKPEFLIVGNIFRNFCTYVKRYPNKRDAFRPLPILYSSTFHQIREDDRTRRKKELGEGTSKATTGRTKRENPWGLENGATVLLFHFGLKALGVTQATIGNDKTNFVRFLHLMIGADADKYLANSDLYGKFTRAPNFKKDELLLQDLKQIREIFKKIHFDSAFPEIDKEIKACEDNLNRENKPFRKKQ